MKISTVVFGGGISTLGISVVKSAVERELGSRVEVSECRPEDVYGIKSADVLFFSLYWFENILDYIGLLNKYGIDPRKRKPFLIIGGSAAVNIRILKGYFHYCVLGDGEIVAPDLIRALLDGSDPSCIEGVIKDGDFESTKLVRTNPIIPANAYTELRDNRTTRIEIARGCRFKCSFCQIGHMKPYREQPIEIVEYLLKQSPTKNVGLFAPDRTGYSFFDRLESTCRRLGKTNTAEDTRLDMLMKKKIISKVKFGIEGFSERSRKRFKKLPKNEQIIAGFDHIFNVLKTPKGKRITTATVYMIGDLPGENADDWADFWYVMREVDKLCHGKFTLFLTLNSFSAKAFTPMEREAIRPYNDWSKLWAARPKLDNITIAGRGGMLGPSNRIIHGVTSRGDERLSRLIFYIATSGRKVFRDRGIEAGRAVENMIRKSGVDPEFIWGELSDSDKLPHDNFSIEK